MEKYIFMALGMVLGIAISLYIYAIKREHYAKRIKSDQEHFSTQKLDRALEKAVDKMKAKMKQQGRVLSEEEKNEIIFGCLNEENNNNN